MKTRFSLCLALGAIACSSPGGTATSNVTDTRAPAGSGAAGSANAVTVEVPRTATPSASSLAATSAPVAAGRCVRDGCWFDDTGACVIDQRPANLRSHRPETSATCTCNETEGACRVVPLDRVPCKTARDCWIDPAPRTHPVARPPALRGRDFIPCKDGEVAPACGPDALCTIGPAYKC